MKGVTEEEDEVVKALLAAGAAVNLRIKDNHSTPLLECVRRCNAAAAKGDSVRAKRRLQRNVAILHLLLSAQAEVRRPTSPNPHQSEALGARRWAPF